MARRCTVFVLVSLLLASCARPTPKTYVVEDDASVVYLEGITTRYSVNMDELRPDGAAERKNRLPYAVVAGDQSLTVAASLFRSKDIFTLDLIIQNHGEEPFDIDRSKFELFDGEGQHLHSMYDWSQGSRYGLRSIRELSRGYAHLGTDFEDAGPGRDKDQPRPESKKRSVREPVDTPSTMNDINSTADFSWISELQMEDETVLLPAVVELMAGRNRPYWAYWKAANGVTYPMTAAVTIDNKRMLFRFDALSE